MLESVGFALVVDEVFGSVFVLPDSEESVSPSVGVSGVVSPLSVLESPVLESLDPESGV